MPSTALTAPSSVWKWTRRSRTESRGSFAGLAIGSVPDPRVEERVGDVDDEVQDDDEERREDDGALDRRHVPPGDRGVGQPPDARDVEHGFGEDRAAEQYAQVDAEDRHERRDSRA